METMMTFYAGFDIKTYRGIQVMNWLNQNTNLKWCGYYLAPAPNRSPCGWTGQYSTISDNWGVLPIYVGQQDPRTATNNYTPSSILTSQQGTIDATDAITLLMADSFPSGTFVYLDWEYGAIDCSGDSDYIKAWIAGVSADGRALPGIYCSHSVAQSIADLLDTLNPTPIVRFWCWNVPTSDAHPFEGDLANIPTIDPSGCGFAGAQMWQREQNAVVTFPDGAPVASLQMDFSTSSLANPGAPSAAIASAARSQIAGRMEIVLPTGSRIVVGADVDAALKRCTSLHFSVGMAGALAGHPIAVRLVE
jgi:hypothetical protein